MIAVASERAGRQRLVKHKTSQMIAGAVVVDVWVWRIGRNRRGVIHYVVLASVS